MTDFCKRCNNILEMTKILPSVADRGNIDTTKEDLHEDILEKKLDTDTPNELSLESDDKSKTGLEKRDVDETKSDKSDKSEDSENGESAELEDFYKEILTIVESGKELTDDQMSRIDIKQMIKSKYYRDLKSKSAIKKQILAMIEDMGNSDENNTFYLFCSNCGYHRSLDPGFHIISKNAEGVASTHDYFDEAKIRLNVHSGICPRTREFKCSNGDCASNKDSKSHPTEACMMREPDSYRMTYVCTSCLTIKRL